MSEALRAATKQLCRNLKDNPNVSDNLAKVWARWWGGGPAGRAGANAFRGHMHCNAPARHAASGQANTTPFTLAPPRWLQSVRRCRRC